MFKFFKEEKPKCDHWYGHNLERDNCIYCDEPNPSLKQIKHDLSESIICSGVLFNTGIKCSG